MGDWEQGDEPPGAIGGCEFLGDPNELLCLIQNGAC